MNPPDASDKFGINGPVVWQNDRSTVCKNMFSTKLVAPTIEEFKVDELIPSRDTSNEQNGIKALD
jgi:hypothetical protein